MNKFKVFFLISTFFFTSCGIDPSFKIEKFDRTVQILGCKLSFADNFSPTATQEDGSCTFTRCLDSTQDNFNNSNLAEINEYISLYPAAINSLKNNCNGRSACIATLASNRDPSGTKENGSCFFSACMDDNYHEFIQNDFTEIGKYLTSWGPLYNGQARVTSTCVNKKQYCQHPEAFNYTGPNVEKGEPYCVFYACTKEKFEGYAKYTSYVDFLKTYPGKILEDNSDTRCGPKLVSTNVKEIDVNRANIKTPIDVVFVIDDSKSMNDEIEKVRQGLINIAPTLQNFNAQINLELHKLNNVNATYKTTLITSTNKSKVTRTEFLRPTPVKVTSINSTIPLGDIQDNIAEGMDLVQASYGDGYEKGVCYIQRILKDFKDSTSKNLITVLLTDEDDDSKGSSKNCYIHTDQDSFKAPPYNLTHLPFKDKSGKDDLVNVVTEGVIDLAKEKKYGLVSIHWNKDKAKCVNNLGSHAESYIRLINQLSNNGKKALEGDLCESDYQQLLDETLTDTIREIIGFKYLIASLDKNPRVQKVEIITLTNEVIELSTADYLLSDDQKDLYLEINESWGDVLKNSKKVRVTVVEDQ